jgi:hypothetical protein
MPSYTPPCPRIASALALLALIATSGCSTVVEGRSQKITVNSSPQGAECILKQADNVVGQITTPGTAEIAKTKNDLVILCSKPGYESVSFNNHSDYSIASLGNMILGEYSFVGNAVDSASGASNKYDSKVFVTLAPAAAPSAFPAPPGAPAVVKLAPEMAAGMSMQVPIPGIPATPLPVSAPAPVAAPMPALPMPIGSNPSINASVALARAALSVPSPAQVMQESYTQALAEAPRRPPFDALQ